MIDVRDAVKTALAYLDGLFGEDSVFDARLEEVELSDDGMYWLVTVSFLRKRPATPGFLPAVVGGYERDYKIVTVDSANGNVKSVKIRQLA